MTEMYSLPLLDAKPEIKMLAELVPSGGTEGEPVPSLLASDDS